MISTTDVDTVTRTVAALEDALNECDELIVYCRRRAEHDHSWRARVSQARSVRSVVQQTLCDVQAMFR